MYYGSQFFSFKCKIFYQSLSKFSGGEIFLFIRIFVVFLVGFIDVIQVRVFFRVLFYFSSFFYVKVFLFYLKYEFLEGDSLFALFFECFKLVFRVKSLSWLVGWLVYCLVIYLIDSVVCILVVGRIFICLYSLYIFSFVVNQGLGFYYQRFYLCY